MAVAGVFPLPETQAWDCRATMGIEKLRQGIVGLQWALKNSGMALQGLFFMYRIVGMALQGLFFMNRIVGMAM
jgi:hypothetical protein